MLAGDPVADPSRTDDESAAGSSSVRTDEGPDSEAQDDVTRADATGAETTVDLEQDAEQAQIQPGLAGEGTSGSGPGSEPSEQKESGSGGTAPPAAEPVEPAVVAPRRRLPRR